MKTILLLIITILNLGCSPEYYVPNSQNIPIMKAKGQTNFGVAYNESESTNGFEIQTAHAISDHIALQFNGDWVKNSNGGYLSDSSDDYKATGRMLEIGVGYFNPITRHFVFETYGLLCFGKLDLKNYTDESGYDNFSAKFNRIGIQPSFSYVKKHFSCSVSSRLTHIKYKDIKGGENSVDFDPNYLKTNNAYWLLEPAITIQAGSENVKFQLQYVYSQNLTDSSFPQEIDIVSFGIKSKIDPKKQIKSLNK